MIKLVLILFLSLNIFASNKYLKSELKSEVYAQNLYEGGYYKKAKKFLKKARAKYPQSESLWSFSASVAYELKEFETAKIYFIKTLELNPKNEQASHFKELIEKQESASENKVLEDLFEYLSDKGIDFLAIFLAFLGGEIIARKYSKCRTLDERNIVKQFKYKEELSDSFSYRFNFVLKNYINRNFTFCSFFQFVILFLISCSVLIFFLLFELLLGISILTSIELSHMNVSDLWEYILTIFVITTFATIVFQFFMYFYHLKSSSKNVDIELSQYLEELSSNNRFDKLYNVVSEFKSLDIKKEEILNDLLSEDCTNRIEYLYKKMEK
ncbi:MAG: hypothetical protein CL624_14255 [Arcobacter sp.]|nr:hypothetical protein [Arcobacter sp.]|tara:strand:+ start:11096 stop:12073 length:978 start_codon:yes stop_codon:yes gene_type:complete